MTIKKKPIPNRGPTVDKFGNKTQQQVMFETYLLKEKMDDGLIILAKMADMATDSLFYRKSAGIGPPEVNTRATLKTDFALTQADIAGLTTADSPVFVTVKCSGLTDGHIPYHNTDATGLDDTNLWTDGTNLGIGMDSANNLIQVLNLINFDNALVSTSLGYEAGKVNAGRNNAFIGYAAGYSNTSGYDNVYIGRSAGYSNTSGYDNVYIGCSAGFVNINGYDNTFIGYAAGGNNIGGDANTFMGCWAGKDNISGDENTCIGFVAGASMTGSHNVTLGARAGYWISSESNSLYIDNAARTNLADAKIKALIYGVFAAATANQYLYLNANVTISDTLITPTLKVTTGAALGSILVSDADGDLTYIADVAVGKYFRSGGVNTNPLWSTLTLPNTATAFKLAAYTATNVMTELVAVGATGEYLAGATGAIPAWATLNQAAVAGLTTADGPTLAHIHLTDLAAVQTIAESWVGPSTTNGIYFKSGNVGIGSTTPTRKLQVVASITDTIADIQGILFYNTFTASTIDVTSVEDGISFSVYGRDLAGGAKKHTTVRALSGAAYNSGTGTVTNLMGFIFAGGCLSTGNITNFYAATVGTYSTGTGKITEVITGLQVNSLDAYSVDTTTSISGINIFAMTTAVGLNKYGIKIGNISGASGDNYSIYTGTGKSYFGGSVGIGSTVFDATGVKVLTIGNGTAPAAHVDDAIQIYSVDSADGTAALGLFCEQAVEAIGTFTATHKIKECINGVWYWRALDAV